MAKISININRPDVTQQDVRTLENYLNGLTAATSENIRQNTGNFSQWLKGKDSRLYKTLSPYISEIFAQIKEFFENILIGAAKIYAGAVCTPMVGIYEGVKEGLNNGLEAGVKKGFNAMGNFLDELFN